MSPVPGTAMPAGTGSFALSYVVSTRNKLPMLREVMARLLRNLKSDEEVVAIDAASTDGTTEFLADLHRSGRIHQFLSEPDQGEAHGFNKGLLRACGELIKVVTDDDVFHWRGIRACAQFMRQHPEVDVIGAEVCSVEFPFNNSHWRSEYGRCFETHRADRKPFEFSGLGLLLRKSSLPLTGLLDPGYVQVDHEFAYRLTAGKARLAWYTGCVAVRLLTPASNTAKFAALIERDKGRFERLYQLPPPPRRNFVTSAVHRFRQQFSPPGPGPTPPVDPVDWPPVFDRWDAWLEDESRANPGRFLTG